MMNRKAMWLLAAVAAVLSGCGGGGGADSSASTAEFPVEATVAKLDQLASSFNVSYTDPKTGDVYMATVSSSPAANGGFEGAVRSASTTVFNIKKNGVAASNASSTDYYSIGPYKHYGSVNSDGTYDITTSFPPLPTSARIGDVGGGIATTSYTSSAKTTVDTMSTSTWSMEAADTSTTAWFCRNDVTRVGSTATVDSTESDCYKINTAGDILALKVTITTGGTTLVFQ